MKSKIQIVVVMTMTALIGASGISADAHHPFGRPRTETGRLPMGAPHSIIGPVCPGVPCIK